LLVEQGFDPEFGARPIRRALRRLIEDPLAEELLKSRFKSGARIRVERDNERLVFRDEKVLPPVEPKPELAADSTEKHDA
jgi:ATP-dependent Clp protease ATP-binding subunit ClpA